VSVVDPPTYEWRCPVCEGEGKVKKLQPNQRSLQKPAEKECQACGGLGTVQGLEVDLWVDSIVRDPEITSRGAFYAAGRWNARARRGSAGAKAKVVAWAKVIDRLKDLGR